MLQKMELGNITRKEREGMDKKTRNIENGTMASNMEEVKFLGKQMERMRDGTQLVEDERIVDPIQYNDEEIQKEKK